MEELLNQIGLSEHAIKIYINSIGHPPLSSFELYSLISNESAETFEKALNELLEIGLLIPIPPQNEESLMQYYAIAPFNPITKYYANINANLDNIKNQLKILLTNALQKIFRENKILELDTIYDKTRDLRNDYQEEVIIQRQEIDDIVFGMENLNVISKILEQFHQIIISITQTHFAELIKFITKIKADIFEKIALLEIKKHENDVKYVIEQVFKDQFDEIVENFIPELHKEIDLQYKSTLESLKNIINSTFQLRNDFKMLLLNMLNSFENNINKILEDLKVKKEKLTGDYKLFEETIVKDFDIIIKNSVDSVTALNHPIEKAMKNYFKTISSKITFQFDIFVPLNSSSRVNEAIKNSSTISQNELLIVVPKLDDHINIEDFQNIKKSVKIKLVSSEPLTNSSVGKLKENKNLEYRTLLNDNVIILLRDDKELIVGIFNKSGKDSLQDFIGFDTNLISLIRLLDPTIRSIWNKASPELHETPKSITVTPSSTTQEVIQQYKPIKKISSDIKEKVQVVDQSETKKELSSQDQQQKGIESSSLKKKERLDKSSDLKETLQAQIDFTSTNVPKSGDASGKTIDAAFNLLIQKLPNLKGEEFSEELDKIAELILEKKGFSVTLHKIRSKINQYKTQISVLSQTDINHIIESINDWKSKLL